MKIKLWPWWLLGISLLFAGLALHAAILESPTVDEVAHLAAGCYYLKSGAYNLYSENPPLMQMLVALPVKLLFDPRIPELKLPVAGWGPWKYSHLFMLQNQDHYLAMFAYARMVVILAGIFCGYLLFFWARELFGIQTALIVTTMYYLSPTVLAHSHLATTDTGCMTSIFLTVFLMYKFRKGKSRIHPVMIGAVWGLALLIKFTAVLLLPVFIIMAFLHPTKRGCFDLLILLITGLAVVNLGMRGPGSMQTLDQYQFLSQHGSFLARVLPGLPLPFPQDFVIGFDAQLHDTETGELGSYFLGRWSQKGSWVCHLTALLIKTPLVFSFMLVLGLMCLKKIPRDAKKHILISMTVLGFFLIFFNHLNIGVRYLLPLFPFFFLIIGAGLFRLSPQVFKIVTILIISISFCTAFLNAPSYLAYFNPLVGANGHRFLIDSNLDWGQDLYRLPQALKELKIKEPIGLLYFGHVDPGLYGIKYYLPPPFPAKGIIAVSVNFLMDASYVTLAPDQTFRMIPGGYMHWLRKFQPVLCLDSIWIYKIDTFMSQKSLETQINHNKSWY